MNHEDTGRLIYTLRKQKKLTQKQLADRMNITDKAISKWERGLGYPDISLLRELACIFEVSLESLLSGKIDLNEIEGGNMKKTKFYICPLCGNLITSTSALEVSCCGRKLQPMTPKKAEEEEKLKVEKIESDHYIHSEHPMTKLHYISFVALLTGESMMVFKLYPEWNLQLRVPNHYHGTLIWYCIEHGLFYQFI